MSEFQPILNEQKQRHAAYVWLVPLVGILLLFGTGAYLWFSLQSEQEGPDVVATEQDEADPIPEPSGRIHLTAMDTGSGILDTYVFDTATAALSRPEGGESMYRMTADVSPDGDMIAYVASPRDQEAAYGFSERLQIHIEDLSTGQTTQVTSDDVVNGKRLPKWSPDGSHLAFTGQKLDSNMDAFPSADLDDWSVLITDLEGNVEVVATGTQPHWGPSGDRILYLGRDGLHVLELTNGLDSLVMEVVGLTQEDVVADVNMKISVSENGQYMSWTSPYRDEVALYRIVSWDPFTYLGIKQMRKPGSRPYWPTFSPDGQFVAVQWSQEEDRDNVWLEIFHVETQTSLLSADLTGLDPDALFITDWAR